VLWLLPVLAVPFLIACAGTGFVLLVACTAVVGFLLGAGDADPDRLRPAPASRRPARGELAHDGVSGDSAG